MQVHKSFARLVALNYEVCTWIIVIDASDHMSPFPSLFTHKNYLVHSIAATLPNSSVIHVNEVGTI